MVLIKRICRMGAMAALVLAFCVLAADASKRDGGNVLYPVASGGTGPALFSHKVHGPDGAGYKCKSCHASDAGGSLGVAMSLLHKSESCGACHNGQTTGPRRRRAAHPVSECATCHMPGEDVAIRLNRMDAALFSHERHVRVGARDESSKPAGFSCGDCHPGPFEKGAGGLPRMELPHERGGCAICHNGKKRKDGLPAAFAATTRCMACHKPSETSPPPK